ncbi:MAG TPA: TadE/TadG family type IV pilus assembly protein [Caulobacteraceae bacterium]|nr:TadE/TadG family type IV pilus assembly protein [Caulobacteraceae bacterium]
MFRRILRLLPLRRLVRDRDGGAIVEFALLAPVLILIVGGACEGGMLFYLRTFMTHCSSEAARSVALGAMEPAEAETWVRGRMATLVDSGVTVAVSETEGGDVTVTTTVAGAPLRDLTPFGMIIPNQVQTRVDMLSGAN